VTGVPRAWRRLVLLACGGALTLGVALPAHAVTTADEPTADAGRPTPAEVAATILPRLDGLPLPRRPVVSGVVAGTTTAPTTAPTTATAPAVPRAREVAVRPGDTLWAIAAADLGPAAGTTAVARHCAELHRLNREVVGADPDLVLPGQRLRLP
jgi:nucleoid-associated protein YgaU